MTIEFLIVFGLILLNGLFAMAEIAIVSARKTKLEQLAAHGDKKAKMALELANKPGKFLSTVQIGITLVSMFTGVYSGAGIAEKLEIYLRNIAPLAPYAQNISIVVVVFIITFLSIIFGELVPKQVGIIKSESVARRIANPLRLLSVIAHPFVWVLTKPGEFLIRILKIKPSDDSKVTEDEIKAIIKEGIEDGEIQEIEQDIVERVFHLGDRKVGSLMTHRTDLVWLDITDNEEKIKEIIITELHSVYPVCDGELDKILGLIYIKDLVIANFKKESIDLKEFIKEPFFVLESNSAYEVLEKFRQTKTHFSLVVDEYGSILGLISLNDILEALVGEMPSGTEVDFDVTLRDDGSYLIDAQIPFYEFLQVLDVQYFDKTKIKYNTLGGMVLNILHHIPRTGEKVHWREYEIEVVDMDGNRIDKVLVTKKS
jgi:putative hemolysin